MITREKLEYLLKAHSDGLTITQMTERTGHSHSYIFRLLNTSKGFHLAEWINSPLGGPRIALWKWSDTPQQNQTRPSAMAAGNRMKVAAPEPQERLVQQPYRAVHTTIRGPWPFALRN